MRKNMLLRALAIAMSIGFALQPITAMAEDNGKSGVEQIRYETTAKQEPESRIPSMKEPNPKLKLFKNPEIINRSELIPGYKAP